MSGTFSGDDWRSFAAALARAGDLRAAFDISAAEVARTRQAPTVIVDRDARGWRMLAESRGGLPLTLADLASALETVPSTVGAGLVDLRPWGAGVWTSIPIDTRENSRLTLLAGGPPDAPGPSLPQLAVWLPVVIGAIRDRETGAAAARLVFDSHVFVRRAGRLDTAEAVGRRLVEQVGRTLGVDRVALAVYRPDEDCLAVTATHGYAAEQVRHARIASGEWVMGHVYASGRPVVVSDARLLRPASAPRQPYRTHSFAVVPIVAGSTAIGVLSATDKTDGSPLDRRDVKALRAFSGVAALALVAAQNGAELKRLSRAANVDSITGLFNRAYFDGRLTEEVERARRSGTALTIVMADIDDFKMSNDTYGHPVGDAVLHAVGGIFRSSVRVFDVCARYGGDEFAILMPSCDQTSAVASAERIRARIAESSNTDPALAPLRRLTVSIGVAVFRQGDTPAELLRRADEALYQAKAEGKDTVRTNGTARPLPPAASGGSWHPGPNE